MTNAIKEGIVAAAMSTDEGRKALAQAMVEPIRGPLEYASVGRKLLQVDDLPQGALTMHEKADLVVARRGAVPTQIQKGEEIFTPYTSEHKLCLTCGSTDTPDCCGFYNQTVERKQQKGDELVDKSILAALLAAAEKVENDQIKTTMPSKDELSASEALFGFMGWLTTRKETLNIGSEHECGEIASLIGEWCDRNTLSKPRDGWENKLN